LVGWPVGLSGVAWDLPAAMAKAVGAGGVVGVPRGCAREGHPGATAQLPGPTLATLSMPKRARFVAAASNAKSAATLV